MELKTYFAQDRTGNLIPSASVSIYLTGTTILASGLTNVSGTALANPFTADADGKIQFRAPDGIYDMQVSLGSTTGVKVTFQCVDVEQQLSDANSAADRAEAAADDIAGKAAVMVSGYDFDNGATLKSPKDYIYDTAKKRWLFWGGSYPAGGKVVAAGSTPESTGGISTSAWCFVGDPNLRNDLAANDGAKFSLSQIATAFGLDVSKGGLWSEGATASNDQWWYYNNKVYTRISGTLPAAPAATAYSIQPFGARNYISVKDFGATGDGTTDDQPSIQAAINFLKSTGGGTLFFPRGVYQVYAPISLVGVRIVLQGSGRDITNIRAAVAMDRVIDIGEVRSSAQANLPCHIRDIGVIGNNLANYCLYQTDRHNVYVSGCQFSGALIANGFFLRNWLSAYRDSSFSGGDGHNVYLAGTNHRVSFDSCNLGSTKNTKYCIYITNEASFDADGVSRGNEFTKALVFNNCDVEYTDASGGKGVFVNALEVAFNSCYIGEFVLGTVMDVTRGLVAVNGGIYYYGSTAASFGINAIGGTTRFKGVLIRPHDTVAQMYVDTLITGTNGKVSFQDISITRDDISGATVPDILNNKQLPGDLLLTIPSPTGSFVPRMGAQYTVESLDVTASNSSETDGSRMFNVTAVGTGSVHQAAFVATIINKLSVPGALLIAVVYSSNVPLPIIIENSAFAGGGTTIGILPSTNGLKKTYFYSYETNSSALPTGNVIRIGGDVVSGSTATLYKVSLVDSLAYNGVSGSTSYKSIGLY